MPVIEYKCPNCGGGMVFDQQSGMLSCGSCGRKDDIESLPEAAEPYTFEEGTKEYQCTSCGAVLMTDAETAATSCSFCGSSVVLADRLTGELAPAKVIPFKIGKEEAMQAFRKWCRNGLLTPDGFMTGDRVKSITGMYVPFWLYDLHNDVEVQAHATRVRTYRRGDYQYTETQHYEVFRELELNYVRVPIDASEKMDDKLMDRLEPFPYEKLKNFRLPYLVGYIAEKYSHDDRALLPRAKAKIQEYIDANIRASVKGYTTVNYESKQINTKVVRTEYTLIPVWVVHYDYKKKHYTFAMNGQTGKVVGKPPVSMAKVSAWFGGIAAASFLSLKLVSWSMGGGFW